MWASARSRRAILAAAVGVCVLVAWRNRFTQDDAYISWTYARHLLEGKGLVWSSAAPPVEGYTNFLWTLIATIPLGLGWDLEWSFQVLGMFLLAASLATVYILVQRVCRDPVAGLCALLATGLSFSFSSYATGGLETQLQTLLILQTALACHRVMQPGTAWPSALGLGIVTLLAALTRLDCAVAIAPMVLVAALVRVRRDGVVAGLAPLAVAGLVAAAGIVPWFAWKLATYGSILPNSFRAKVQSFLSWEVGFRYLAAFFWSNFYLAPLLGVGAAVVTARRDRRVAETALLALPLLVWLLYVARVGGDFMEFRLLVPAIPLALMLCFVGVRSCVESPVVGFAVLAVILAGSEHHRRFYTTGAYGGPTSIGSLAEHLETDHEAWREIGRRLHAGFAGAAVKPSIAVTPAGAIVFYSDLPAIDMLGVNDADVERFTVLPFMMVGHNHLIPLDELRRRGANFLIGHPVLQNRPPPDRQFTFEGFSARRFFKFEDEEDLRGLKLIEMPLPGDRVMLMVYLTEDPAIDARLRELGWRVYPTH